jgi:3-hydroxyisobutyrate dehydrogenase-like beta-hydroxyacid dehydrogenase
MSKRLLESVAVLGLGEAGATFATGLVARRVRVTGYDPDPARLAEGVVRAGTPAAAVAGADAVLSLNAQSVAVSVAEEAAGALAPGQLFADLNTASAEVKRRVAAAVAASGASFADVALLGPVPQRGIETPCLASGDGAARFAELFGPLGTPVETVGTEPGAASTRKLLRSIFMKGLAAAVIESLDAATAAGCEPWLRADIAATLTSADAALVERLVEGSRAHAVRRVGEMEAAAALERELGVEPRVAEAAAELLRTLATRPRD